MEKKTIGKFIAALRKANGMTQKEFGEKLFVSDKTVSRWECDECAPDLSLIPAIAEIFGITSDELLRGERNNPARETESAEETDKNRKAKSDRQFRLMLDRKRRKYQNFSLISVGITVFGLLAAMVANLGFSKGLIAFCLSAAFGVASEICQICFTVNAQILPDEDDDTYTERIKAFHTQTVKTAVRITFVNLLLLAFCLPLVTLINGANYGLTFDTWIPYGTVFSAVALAVCYSLYTFFIRKILCEKGLLVLAEQQRAEIKRDNKLLFQTIAVSAAVALVLGVCIVVWNVVGLRITIKKHTFDNGADFKAFMESEYDRWAEEGYSYVDQYGDIIVNVPIGESGKTYGYIKNAEGEIICEYYYNPDLYKEIRGTASADDRMPVTVIRKDDYYQGMLTFRTVETALYVCIVMDFVVAAGIYLFKMIGRKKKAASAR
ncbi:MAG: helix-turn-helix transcriptional regulator [Clostridia bacterium]|nr:helix-turn-helix transcriptional regulator [Clostridia bacterium]